IEVTAATTFLVYGFPSPVQGGTASSFTVVARDAYGRTVPGYTGTVHFTSTDLLATLPADYTFTAADNGTHTFTATLRTGGAQSLTATDPATAGPTGTQAGIQVKVPPAANIGGPSAGVRGQTFTFTL